MLRLSNSCYCPGIARTPVKNNPAAKPQNNIKFGYGSSNFGPHYRGEVNPNEKDGLELLGKIIEGIKKIFSSKKSTPPAPKK